MTYKTTLSNLSLEAVNAIARALVPTLHKGDVIALYGDLGVGKTTFTRACLVAMSGDEALDVPSPTFTIIQTYDSAEFTTPALHMDLYRTTSAHEVEELGVEDLLPHHITFVEWPDHGAALWADHHLAIHMDMDASGERTWQLVGHGVWAQRLPRVLALKTQLDAWGYGQFRRTPMAGDASSRRYERLHIGGEFGAPRLHKKHENDTVLVIMDAPPKPDSGISSTAPAYSHIAHLAEDQTAFVAISKALNFRGFAAPKVFYHDIAQGILVLEDLGHEGVLDATRAPIPDRYIASAKALAMLHSQKFTGTLPIPNGQYTLPPYDLPCMMAEVDLFLQWGVPDVLGTQPSAAQCADFKAIWEDMLAPISQRQETLVLRDFHSPNIIWCDERPMPKTIGMIDFQDGLHGPFAYDVASLGQDARVDVPLELEQALLLAYCTTRVDSDEHFNMVQFRADYALMGAQRATKILGIFSRLCIRDHKPHYKAHQPRVWGYLRHNLRHGVLAPYEAWLKSTGLMDALNEKFLKA